MLRALIAFLFLSLQASAEAIPAGFNDEGLQWHDLESGLARADAEGKAVFVVAHATWCPVCREYSKLFFDERVEAAAENLIFVLIDVDAELEAGKQFEPDGGYVPRSFVVVDGEIQTDIRGAWDEYKYFLNPEDSKELLSVLDRAIALR